MSKLQTIINKGNKKVGEYPLTDIWKTNSKYLQFRHLWSKKICSKKEWFSEAWDFFFNKENLNIKNYPNKRKLKFEDGVPINFKI